ncbi:hypothetical protein HOD75_01215 [archaeon]|jgi:hypothetical protein|nr:hypothetical protein [archaeon]MBT4241498.1 hypothetical protein [archaeon]MBT4417631.1 hypothetical protein [archaeon]
MALEGKFEEKLKGLLRGSCVTGGRVIDRKGADVKCPDCSQGLLFAEEISGVGDEVGNGGSDVKGSDWMLAYHYYCVKCGYFKRGEAMKMSYQIDG